MRRTLVCLLALAGCRQILGIDDLPDARTNEAGPIDVSPIDAPNTATLSLAVATQTLAQKSTTMVPFTIVRGASETGALTVVVGGLPTGVTANDVVVAAGATSGTLAIDTASSATLLSAGSLSVALNDGAQTLDTKQLAFTIVGAHGALDPTFGTNGSTQVPIPDPNAGAPTTNGTAAALLVYPPTAGANADKILVAATLATTGTTRAYAVVRFTAAGKLDTTFNTKGYTVVTSTATSFTPAAIAFDSQGRVVVTARADCLVNIQRLLATGAIDTSFNAYQGHANPDNSCGAALSVATLAGDKILSLSLTNVSSDQSIRPALVAFTSDGFADPSMLGVSNFVVPNPEMPTRKSLPPTRLVVDAQGRYLIAGEKCDGGYNTPTDPLANCESAIGRLSPNGQWDKSFSADGFNAVAFGTANTQAFAAIAIDHDDNVVVGGSSALGATLARFSGTTGALDPSFAGTGSLTTTLGGGAAPQFSDVVVDTADNVIAVGAVNNNAVVTRYTKAGALDTTFGTTTISSTGLPHGAALQSNGRLVVAASFPRAGGGYDVAVWRIWP